MVAIVPSPAPPSPITGEVEFEIIYSALPLDRPLNRLKLSYRSHPRPPPGCGPRFKCIVVLIAVEHERIRSISNGKRTVRVGEIEESGGVE